MTLQDLKSDTKRFALRIMHNIYVLLAYPDIAPARFLCAYSSMTFGALLLFSGDALSDPDYIIFYNIMGPIPWATLFFTVGGINMLTLIGRLTPGWYSTLLAFIQMMLWVFVNFAFALPWLNGHHRVSAEGVVAWMAIWVFIRSRNGNEEDIQSKINHNRRSSDHVGSE